MPAALLEHQRAEVHVLDTWRVRTMRGPGSNSVVAESLFVTADNRS